MQLKVLSERNSGNDRGGRARRRGARAGGSPQPSFFNNEKANRMINEKIEEVSLRLEGRGPRPMRFAPPSGDIRAGMAIGRVRDDGSQQSKWVATADLPQSAGHPFYERLNRILGGGRVRRVRRRPVRAVLRGDAPAESGSRTLLPIAAHRVLRRAGLGAGHRVARGGFAEHAGVSAFGGAGGTPGPFDDFADASAVPGGDPSGGVHLGAGAVGGGRAWLRGRHWGSMRRRWRRTRRCGASFGVTRARITRRS